MQIVKHAAFNQLIPLSLSSCSLPFSPFLAVYHPIHHTSGDCAPLPILTVHTYPSYINRTYISPPPLPVQAKHTSMLTVYRWQQTCGYCLVHQVGPLSRDGSHLGRPAIIIIIIRQPLCPVVGRRPQHVVSK